MLSPADQRRRINPLARYLVAAGNALGHVWPDAKAPGARLGFVADVLLIAVIWAIVRMPYLLGRSFIPWDSADAFFPQTKFVVTAVLNGQAPWWNPYLYGGQPVLGDPQGMIFTPQSLVGILAGNHFNLHIFDVTTLFVELCGGIALARYARAYSNTRTLPILGALVFFAGGVATSRLQHVTQIDSYGLLPLQILALRAVCLRPRVLRTFLLTAVLTATALNPNQVVFLSAFAFLPFVLLHLYQSPRRGAAILSLAVAALFVLAASLPSMSAIGEFVALSVRSSMSVDASGISSFPPFNLASVFLPGLYGVLSSGSGNWPPTDLTQDFLYIGIIPVLAVITSLFCVRGVSAMTVLCWGSLLFWFIFAMGTNTPLYPFLFNHLPGFSAFRRPADGAYFLNLFLALLIGTSRAPDRSRFGAWPAPAILAVGLLFAFGWVLTLLAFYAQRVGHAPDLLAVLRAFGVRLMVVAAVGVALGCIDRRAARYLAAPLALGLTIADLGYFSRAGSVFAPRTQGSEVAGAYAGALASDKPATGLEESINFLKRNGVAGENPAYRMEAIGGSLGGSMPIAFQILTTQGYNPINLRAYNEAVGAQYLQVDAKRFTEESPSYDSQDYRRLSLRYVLIHSYIAEHSGEFGAFGATVANIRATFAGSDWAKKLPANGEYEIWEMQNPLPRAMVPADNTENACEITSYQTVSVSVRCHAAAPGRLVLGDAFAPGWRACVNGNPAPVEPYQSIFRSVSVPDGDSQVVFRYQPVPFLRHSGCPAG